jgi:hypothetical protein
MKKRFCSVGAEMEPFGFEMLTNDVCYTKSKGMVTWLKIFKCTHRMKISLCHRPQIEQFVFGIGRRQNVYLYLKDTNLNLLSNVRLFKNIEKTLNLE